MEQSKSLKDLEEKTNASVQQTRLDYKQWEQSHARYLQQPPTGAAQGKTFIRHAQTLLAFLYPISEIHPVFKSVVGTFKTILSYEDERGENDSRVSCVFLAQSHMMEMILRMYRDSDSGFIDRDTLWIQDVVDGMEKEIKQCGNTIDAYYNCRRMVRFMRAMDWKNQFVQHVDKFNALRGKMLDHLALSSAQDQRDLHKTLNKILLTLTTPTRPWEIAVAALDKEHGREKWVDDYFALREVLLGMGKEDGAEDYKKLLTAGKDGGGSAKEQSLAMETVDNARRSLISTVNEIRTKNSELFDRKLSFLATRLEKAIDNSAKFIVQSLDGPHARLENEDLRKLWKEMKWIFCVDSSTFVNSLFEFYRDKFTTVMNPHSNATDGTESPERQPTHPDAWTLEFLVGSEYIPLITAAFDQDKSGFVRITEANALTRLMPPNFTLAQWCAFEACGRIVEGRMYQLRIQRLMLFMTELQNKILPSNLALFANFFDIMIGVLHPIVDSVSFKQPAYIPPELEALVKAKMDDQDEQLRSDLARLRFDLDGENTIRMIFGKDAPLEQYLLRLFLIVSEHWAMIEELATEDILDGREWKRMAETLTTIRNLIRNRVTELTKGLSTDEAAIRLYKTHDSIYYLFFETFLTTNKNLRGEPHNDFDEAHYFESLTLIKSIPLLGPPRNLDELLRYPTWAQYHEEIGLPMEADVVIPFAWGLSEEEQKKYAKEERKIVQPPYHLHCCDNCNDFPLVGQPIYRCFHCDYKSDIFCSECYKKEKHNPEHPLLRTTTFVPSPLNTWLSSLGVYMVAQSLSNISESDGARVSCSECKEVIQEGEMVAQCVGDFDTCPDYQRCMKCLDEFQDDTAGHKSWHHVIIIPELKRDISKHLNDALKAEESGGTVLSTSEEIISRRVGGLEDRMSALEEKLDEGLKTIQGRIDMLLGFLESKLGSAVAASA